MIITIQHMHSIPTWNGRSGFCHKSSRAWFKAHDLDFLDFARNGIEEEKLAATNDYLALSVIEWAHKCEAKKQAGAVNDGE